MNEAFNNGYNILRKEIAKLKAERDELVTKCHRLEQERDAAVAYLEELCDAFGNMACGCECCPLDDSENLDEDGNALCKVWSSGLSLASETSDKKEG